MCDAQNISVLGLQQNIFEGQLPMDWAQAGRWPSLGYLQLWNNSLSGSVPRLLGQCHCSSSPESPVSPSYFMLLSCSCCSTSAICLPSIPKSLNARGSPMTRLRLIL